MTLVAGVDSSTQSCTVVVADADDGRVVRTGAAPHPAGTEVDPSSWWDALLGAIEGAGGIADVEAVAVGAQQHGMVCLDDDGKVVRPALPWNDTRSATAARDLVDELGEATWAAACGSVPVASYTITKLRWLAEHEPALADRVAAVCLPHDWLSWRLSGSDDLRDLRTDRGDASGTGYWSPAAGAYRLDLLERAFGRTVHVPEVAEPAAGIGQLPGGAVIAPGTGDNMAAALGLGAGVGDVVISIGTSGTVFATSPVATADPTGTIAGFADATGRFLPLACTLNGAPVLGELARLLGVDLHALSDLALQAPAGAGGLVVVPYLAGERTPNRPHATGALFGMRSDNLTSANVARATVEGLLCGLRAGLDALARQGIATERVLLTGGGSQSLAVQAIAPAIFGHPVSVVAPTAAVARGAARQAAWVLRGGPEPPEWPVEVTARHDAPPAEHVVDQYRHAEPNVVDRAGG